MICLLELCLLSLLSPQEPATPTTPTAPGAVATTAVQAAQGDDHDRLLAAEQAGDKADPQVLRKLADAPDAAIAARAAWLLGKLNQPQAVELLREVATGSPHAEARLQAMQPLTQRSQLASFATAVEALGDADLHVRTLAAQLLGKLRRPAAVAPLMAMVERGPRTTDRPATDLQAALLSLHDLGAGDQLLRIATALDDRPANGTGQALTWCFQELSPKLDRKAQATLLVAALDHREPLLRRYAIGRLAELAVPSTANALEGRLAKETAELRPLVEVALAQVRGDDKAPPSDEMERALANGKNLLAAARTRWDRMPMQDRIIATTIPVSLLMVLMLAGRLRRRRSQSVAAAATVALVAPSEEHLEQLAAEAEAEAEAMAAAAEAEIADDEVFEQGEAETDGWGEPVDADANADAGEYVGEDGFGRR
jgi:HEAT repeat protein